MERGQMKLSFGMIVSIILIIVFLVAAFYAISFFLKTKDTATIGIFVDSLQSDVTAVWKAAQADQPVSYALPKAITKVCFEEQSFDGDTNLYFLPLDKGGFGQTIEHLDLAATTASEQLRREDPENAFCVDVVEGKVSFLLHKTYGEAAVTLRRLP